MIALLLSSALFGCNVETSIRKTNVAASSDTTSPTVTNVFSTLANGRYGQAQVVDVDISFSEKVNVDISGGAPKLLLNTDTPRYATYLSGSGTTSLKFRYTVFASDLSDDLDYASTNALTTNGGTIKDSSGNNAILTLPAVGGTSSLGGQKAIMINAKRIDLFAGMLDSVGRANGTLSNSRFSTPSSLVNVGADIYVTDGHVIRKISSGVVSKVAGLDSFFADVLDGVGNAAGFSEPIGMAAIGTNVYISDTGNSTIRMLDTLTGVVSTIAGDSSNVGSSNGTGSAASFNTPIGITTDGTDLYVADSANSLIRKVTTTGVVTTIANSASVTSPYGITFLGGFLYITDQGKNQIIKMTTAGGSVSSIAGDAVFGTGTADGTGAVARFGMPSGITNDGTFLYVADMSNFTIRKVTTGGLVSTIAGSAGVPGSVNGIGAAARFMQPTGVLYQGGKLLIADMGSSVIEQMDTTTLAVTTYAGILSEIGSADGVAGNARFNGVSSITSDGADVYVADSGNYTIRKINHAGVTSLYAGQVGVIGNGNGAKLISSFGNIVGLVFIGSNLYVADGCLIRVITPDGEVANFAGTTVFGSPTCGDIDGTGASAGFSWMSAMTTDGTNLYVSEASEGVGAIRKITATGVVTTITTSLSMPHGITSVGGFLYVTDDNGTTIKKINSTTGTVSVLAGDAVAPGGYINGYVDAVGTAARFDNAYSITSDGLNYLYVADTTNALIRRISVSSGMVTTFAGSYWDSSNVDGPLTQSSVSGGFGTFPVAYTSMGFFVGSTSGIRIIH